MMNVFRTSAHCDGFNLQIGLVSCTYKVVLRGGWLWFGRSSKHGQDCLQPLHSQGRLPSIFSNGPSKKARLVALVHRVDLFFSGTGVQGRVLTRLLKCLYETAITTRETPVASRVWLVTYVFLLFAVSNFSLLCFSVFFKFFDL